MNTNLKKINILDVGISQLNIEQCIQSISDKIESSSKGYVTVTGAHGLIESSKSDYIKLIHNNSFLTIPDGMPLVWVSKLKGSKNISRCFGPEMMFEFFHKTRDSHIKHFFYGGNVGVADELKQAMELKFPKTKIVGTYCPPFRNLNNEEEQDLFERVKKTKPDIIWVGLSTPKQEIFMYEYLPKLDTKIMIGVGAAFDYHTGKITIAPRWIQNMGLEWFFRLCMEPKRLYKRYFEIVPKFLFLSLRELIQKR